MFFKSLKAFNKYLEKKYEIKFAMSFKYLF